MRLLPWLLTVFALTLAACGNSPTGSSRAEAARKLAPTVVAAPATGAAGLPAALPAGWGDADLRQAPHPLPLLIKAPVGYIFGSSPLFDVEIVSKQGRFVVNEITNYEADFPAKIKRSRETNSASVFEKYVLEQPDGYIAQFQFISQEIFIPCRYVTLGGRKYEFTIVPLDAPPSEEEARQFYDLAGLARTN